MKIKATSFEYTSYNFEPKKKKITFTYKINFINQTPLIFKEKIILPKIPFLEKIPMSLLDNLLQSVHIILGISYYKLYCPSQVKLNKLLSKQQADFWNIVYKKGLGEFFYKNKINPKNSPKFPYDKNIKLNSSKFERSDRCLLGIGGGKDSIVAAELLKNNGNNITALLIETQQNLKIGDDIVKELNISSIKISRFLDENIFKEYEDSYNGHIPISAIFAFLGFLSAVLYNYSYVIVANEHSSNFGNVKYKGEMINHQWSKSAEFEKLFQKYTKEFITPDITYFSILRPFYEIRIVEMFSKLGKYFSYFSSCNQIYKIYKKKQDVLWCGKCPKCIFLFILLSAFFSKENLLKIFKKNLYENKNLLQGFKDVLGFGKLKPFDCVGTFEETRVAFYLAGNKFKNDFIMKKFLPKIKDVKKFIKKVFQTEKALTIPSKFRFVGIKSVLILGYGKEGRLTKQYLETNFPKMKIGIADQKYNSDCFNKQINYDLAIKTPGICKENVTIQYTTATNIFFSQIKNKTIGITGSKGKSTTASLVYEILKEAGKKVRLIGNIGNPMLEILMQPIDKNEIFVIELSSYQLDDIEFSPNIAIVTNLFQEHMNYHKDVKNYYKAKKNIINFQKETDFFIYNSQIRKLKEWGKNSKSISMSFEKISLDGFNTSLLGEHNRKNIKAAVAVAKLFNIPLLTIKKAVKNFKALSHRLEFVGKFQNIKFYDDAISTTPQSTIAAIKSLPKIGTILLGGQNRGYDFFELEKEIKKNKINNIVLFPDSGKDIFKSTKGLNILETSSMEDAVNFAYVNTNKEEICLLSTASPSYSIWKNFEEKGDQFQYFVKKYS